MEPNDALKTSIRGRTILLKAANWIEDNPTEFTAHGLMDIGDLMVSNVGVPVKSITKATRLGLAGVIATFWVEQTGRWDTSISEAVIEAVPWVKDPAWAWVSPQFCWVKPFSLEWWKTTNTLTSEPQRNAIRANLTVQFLRYMERGGEPYMRTPRELATPAALEAAGFEIPVYQYDEEKVNEDVARSERKARQREASLRHKQKKAAGGVTKRKPKQAAYLGWIKK